MGAQVFHKWSFRLFSSVQSAEVLIKWTLPNLWYCTLHLGDAYLHWKLDFTLSDARRVLRLHRDASNAFLSTHLPCHLRIPSIHQWDGNESSYRFVKNLESTVPQFSITIPHEMPQKPCPGLHEALSTDALPIRWCFPLFQCFRSTEHSDKCLSKINKYFCSRKQGHWLISNYRQIKEESHSIEILMDSLRNSSGFWVVLPRYNYWTEETNKGTALHAKKPSEDNFRSVSALIWR